MQVLEFLCFSWITSWFDWVFWPPITQELMKSFLPSLPLPFHVWIPSQLWAPWSSHTHSELEPSFGSTHSVSQPESGDSWLQQLHQWDFSGGIRKLQMYPPASVESSWVCIHSFWTDDRQTRISYYMKKLMKQFMTHLPVPQWYLQK